MEKDKHQCIIHYATCDKEEEHLVSPKDISSWLALLEAAKARNHQPVLDVAITVEENHIPNIADHRKCRSLFTMKRDLESIKQKREESVDEDANPTKRQCRRPSTAGRVYNPVCIFCNKVKFMKNPKSREKLIQAVQLRADTTLRHCAILNNDARILAITSRDIVAAEAHYHAASYKSYTNIKTKERDHVQLFHSFHIRRSYQLPSLQRNWKRSCPARVKLSKLPRRRTSVEGLSQNWEILSIFSQIIPERCCWFLIAYRLRMLSLIMIISVKS